MHDFKHLILEILSWSIYNDLLIESEWLKDAEIKQQSAQQNENFNWNGWKFSRGYQAGIVMNLVGITWVVLYSFCLSCLPFSG